MSRERRPIAAGLWTDDEPPCLIGGRTRGGRLVFPFPEGTAAADVEPVRLSRRGRLWSYTRQDFRPKYPYDGPEPFEPFLVGYVELPGELIVETRLVDTTLDALEPGLPMELVIVPFDDARSVFAFRPESAP